MKGNFYNSSIGKLLLIEDEVGIKEIKLIEDRDKEEDVEISESDNINSLMFFCVEKCMYMTDNMEER